SSTLHDRAEDAVNSPRHVACSDCHNSHASTSKQAAAPQAPGAIAGVMGVNAAGATINSVVQEYELCLRCHGDSVARGRTLVNRQIPETNARREFSPVNQSFHSVMSVGKNANVPSLIAPWTPSSLMYCTDCHNNDQGPRAGGSGPDGPHGSAYPPLLERQLVLT